MLADIYVHFSQSFLSVAVRNAVFLVGRETDRNNGFVIDKYGDATHRDVMSYDTLGFGASFINTICAFANTHYLVLFDLFRTKQNLLGSLVAPRSQITACHNEYAV